MIDATARNLRDLAATKFMQKVDQNDTDEVLDCLSMQIISEALPDATEKHLLDASDSYGLFCKNAHVVSDNGSDSPAIQCRTELAFRFAMAVTQDQLDGNELPDRKTRAFVKVVLRKLKDELVPREEIADVAQNYF